jgi:hypothetical protein
VTETYEQTRRFKDARFRQVDLSGAAFRECDLSGVRIAGSLTAGLRIDGADEQGAPLLVDGVDVTPYVRAELDRRHPERVRVREMATADEFRAMWDTVEQLWAEARAEAERRPEAARYERVGGEWSFTETLRHLVFAVDGWLGLVTGDGPGYHPLSMPPTDLSPEDAAAMGLDVTAEVPYDVAVALHTNRLARVRAVLAGLTDDVLAEPRTGVLSPAWGEETFPVHECLRTITYEHCAHRWFALRDLAALS